MTEPTVRSFAAVAEIVDGELRRIAAEDPHHMIREPSRQREHLLRAMRGLRTDWRAACEHEFPRESWSLTRRAAILFERNERRVLAVEPMWAAELVDDPVAAKDAQDAAFQTDATGRYRHRLWLDALDKAACCPCRSCKAPAWVLCRDSAPPVLRYPWDKAKHGSTFSVLCLACRRLETLNWTVRREAGWTTQLPYDVQLQYR